MTSLRISPNNILLTIPLLLFFFFSSSLSPYPYLVTTHSIPTNSSPNSNPNPNPSPPSITITFDPAPITNANTNANTNSNTDSNGNDKNITTIHRPFQQVPHPALPDDWPYRETWVAVAALGPNGPYEVPGVRFRTFGLPLTSSASPDVSAAEAAKGDDDGNDDVQDLNKHSIDNGNGNGSGSGDDVILLLEEEEEDDHERDIFCLFCIDPILDVRGSGSNSNDISNHNNGENWDEHPSFASLTTRYAGEFQEGVTGSSIAAYGLLCIANIGLMK